MTDRTFYASTYVVADGHTQTWPFSFAGVSPEQESGTTPYIFPEDVRVQESYTDADGNRQTVQRAGTLNTPNAITISGPPVQRGREIRIYRETELRFPLVDYRDLQSVSEHDLDLANRQAVFIAQEGRDAASANLLYDKQGHFNAGGRRIVNLADGSDPRDAVTMRQHTGTLRVADGHLPFLPSAAERAGKLVSFDAAGWPVTTFPQTSSALDLEMRLANDGAKLSGWTRKPLSSRIDTLAGVADSTDVNLWEPALVDLVTDRPDPQSPRGWDWSPAVNALSTLAQILGRINVRLPKELTIRKPVTIDINRVVLTGQSSVLCEIYIPDSYAVTFTSTTATTPYSHNLQACSNVAFIGDRVGHGLCFTGTTSLTAASHILFNSVAVQRFVNGITFLNNAYILNFLNCDGWDCSANVLYQPPGTINAGERMTFIGCTYYNSNTIAYIGAGEWYFTNCSFDFSKRLVYARGMATFADCHGEFLTGEGHNAVITVEFATTDKSTVVMKGGEWLNLATKSPYIVEFINPTTRRACRCIVDNIYAYGFVPSSGYWGTGPGRLTVTRLASTAWNASVIPFTHKDNNLLADGNFETTGVTPVDSVYISQDSGGSISGRYSSANLKVEVSTDYAKTGTKSLRIRRSGGYLSAATVTIAVPIKERNVGFRFDMLKPTQGAGTVQIGTEWGLAGDVYGAAVPTVRKSLFAASHASYGFTGATAEWVPYKAFTGYLDAFGMVKYDRETKERPDWANVFLINIRLQALSGTPVAEDVYLDNFEVFEL